MHDSIRVVFRYVFKRSPKVYLALGITSLVLLILYGFFIAAPLSFPVKRVVVIPRGSTLSDIANQLYGEHIIRSPLFFRLLVRIDGSGNVIRAGAYQFESPISVFGITNSLLYGEYEIEPVKVTFPEGATVKEMSVILKESLPGFDENRFLEIATPKEGYLFPDTYLLAPGTPTEEIVTLLEETFTKRVETLLPEISRSGKSIGELVIMASLLEKEARSYDVRRTIAGILWKRIELEMPLQVDAVFGYIRGTKTYNPKFNDLKIESPYNTYTNKGLPPGAIGNPGIEAIRAAATPLKTKYLFYLTDREGRMHYSSNFEGHVRNRALYLDS
jgi:UPF0755 protein